jgi:hypothetical protein
MATAEKRVALGSGLALERYRREVTPTKRIRRADGAGEKAVGRGPAPRPPPTLRGSADVDLAHTGAADPMPPSILAGASCTSSGSASGCRCSLCSRSLNPSSASSSVRWRSWGS